MKSIASLPKEPMPYFPGSENTGRSNPAFFISEFYPFRRFVTAAAFLVVFALAVLPMVCEDALRVLAAEAFSLADAFDVDFPAIDRFAVDFLAAGFFTFAAVSSPVGPSTTASSASISPAMGTAVNRRVNRTDSV